MFRKKKIDPIKTHIESMRRQGYRHYEMEDLAVGDRVRNRNQQFIEAREGTATVIAIMRCKGEWEQKYDMKNVEVLVKRDIDDSLGWWQDYMTILCRPKEDNV